MADDALRADPPYGLSGLSSGASPDRMDALVWAITALKIPRN
jgi:phage terminase large subunit-like protein